MTCWARCGGGGRAALGPEHISVWSCSYSLGCGADKGAPEGGDCLHGHDSLKGTTTMAKDVLYNCIVITKYSPYFFGASAESLVKQSCTLGLSLQVA